MNQFTTEVDLKGEHWIFYALILMQCVHLTLINSDLLGEN